MKSHNWTMFIMIWCICCGDWCCVRLVVETVLVFWRYCWWLGKITMGCDCWWILTQDVRIAVIHTDWLEPYSKHCYSPGPGVSEFLVANSERENIQKLWTAWYCVLSVWYRVIVFTVEWRLRLVSLDMGVDLHSSVCLQVDCYCCQGRIGRFLYWVFSLVSVNVNMIL